MTDRTNHDPGWPLSSGCVGDCCSGPTWEFDCKCCEGTGSWESGQDCETCRGSGRVTIQRPTWRKAAELETAEPASAAGEAQDAAGYSAPSGKPPCDGRSQAIDASDLRSTILAHLIFPTEDGK